MTSFTEKIDALIFEIKNELGKNAAKPITIELMKASLAARKLETLERCDREIANCLKNQQTLPPEHKIYAAQGEVDWLSEKQRLMEETV